MSRQAAIIRNARLGVADRGIPVLSFDTYVSENVAAGQTLSWDAAFEVMKRFADVRELNGKPCWVEVGDGLIRFLGLWES